MLNKGIIKTVPSMFVHLVNNEEDHGTQVEDANFDQLDE